MAFDAHKNFSVSTVLTAPSPATSGTSLVVQASDGTKFPAVSFNAVVFPVGQLPTTTNAEIVRVTNISTDTFTITRAQESSVARSIIVGDQIAAAITLKAWTDIEAGTNFPALGTTGLLTVTGFGAHTFSAAGSGVNSIGVRNTTSGAANYGGFYVGNNSVANLCYVEAYSSAYTPAFYALASGVSVGSTGAGGLSVVAENASGIIRFYANGTTERMRVSGASGLSECKITNPTAGAAQYASLTIATDAVATCAFLQGYSSTYTPAAYIFASGCVVGGSGAGGTSLIAEHASGSIRFYSNGATLRGKVDAGWQIGAPTGGDKGAGTMNFAADIYKNNTAFTNPQWALKHAFTGLADADGPYAAPPEYTGLMDLEAHEQFTRATFDLPLMVLKRDGGLFERGDMLMASLEEAYLYIYQLHHRLEALEARAPGRSIANHVQS